MSFLETLPEGSAFDALREAGLGRRRSSAEFSCNKSFRQFCGEVGSGTVFQNSLGLK